MSLRCSSTSLTDTANVKASHVETMMRSTPGVSSTDGDKRTNDREEVDETLDAVYSVEVEDGHANVLCR